MQSFLKFTAFAISCVSTVNALAIQNAYRNNMNKAEEHGSLAAPDSSAPVADAGESPAGAARELKYSICTNFEEENDPSNDSQLEGRVPAAELREAQDHGSQFNALDYQGNQGQGFYPPDVAADHVSEDSSDASPEIISYAEQREMLKKIFAQENDEDAQDSDEYDYDSDYDYDYEEDHNKCDCCCDQACAKGLKELFFPVVLLLFCGAFLYMFMTENHAGVLILVIIFIIGIALLVCEQKCQWVEAYKKAQNKRALQQDKVIDEQAQKKFR